MAILFIHGWLGSRDDWSAVAKLLGTENILIDLPGHGPASRDRDVPDFTSLIQHIAAQLVAPVHLVGYSMGGRIAMHLALAAPERIRSLSLISASPGMADEADRARRRTSDAVWAERLRSGPIDAVLRDWYRQPLFASLARKPELLENLIARRRQADAARLADALIRWGQGTVPALWGHRMNVPVQWIVGADDPAYLAIADRIRAEQQERVVVIPGAGHAVHLEQPAALADSIRSFIKELES